MLPLWHQQLNPGSFHLSVVALVEGPPSTPPRGNSFETHTINERRPGPGWAASTAWPTGSCGRKVESANRQQRRRTKIQGGATASANSPQQVGPLGHTHCTLIHRPSRMPRMSRTFGHCCRSNIPEREPTGTTTETHTERETCRVVGRVKLSERAFLPASTRARTCSKCNMRHQACSGKVGRCGDPTASFE